VEAFFGNLVSRSRVQEALKALLAARELSFVHTGARSLIQVAPPRSIIGERLPAQSARSAGMPRRS